MPFVNHVYLNTDKWNIAYIVNSQGDLDFHLLYVMPNNSLKEINHKSDYYSNQRINV